MKQLGENYRNALIEISEYCEGFEESVLTGTDFDESLDTDDFDAILDLI